MSRQRSDVDVWSIATDAQAWRAGRDSLAKHPDFPASLKLLVEREQYSYSDVAAMFGVSRERVRQWCKAHQVVSGARQSRGLFATRVWNDTEHRFVPVVNGELAKKANTRLMFDRAMARHQALHATRQEALRVGLPILHTLMADLGRTPTWGEMAQALGIPTDLSASAPRVLNYFHAPMVRCGSGKGWRRSVPWFRKVTGIPAVLRGSPGHRPGCDCCRRAGRGPNDA